MWSHTRKIINKSKLCHIFFFILLFFFGNAKFCHVRPVPPYPFWLSDESRSTCPALPCPASWLSFSLVQVPMQFLISQSDVALWDKLPVFNFNLNTCFSSKQFREASTKPNDYKMVINCGPNMQIMREREREK